MPLWVAVTPIYNRALTGALDLSLRLAEPHDMGHRIKLEKGSISVGRWIYGVSPMEFEFQGEIISFNVITLLVLLLASPMPFGKRFLFAIVVSLLILFLLQTITMLTMAINPFPFLDSPLPANALLYLKRLEGWKFNVTAALTRELLIGGWTFFPVVIWAAAGGLTSLISREVILRSDY